MQLHAESIHLIVIRPHQKRLSRLRWAHQECLELDALLDLFLTWWGSSLGHCKSFFNNDNQWVNNVLPFCSPPFRSEISSKYVRTSDDVWVSHVGHGWKGRWTSLIVKVRSTRLNISKKNWGDGGGGSRLSRLFFHSLAGCATWITWHTSLRDSFCC